LAARVFTDVVLTIIDQGERLLLGVREGGNCSKTGIRTHGIFVRSLKKEAMTTVTKG